MGTPCQVTGQILRRRLFAELVLCASGPELPRCWGQEVLLTQQPCAFQTLVLVQAPHSACLLQWLLFTALDASPPDPKPPASSHASHHLQL